MTQDTHNDDSGRTGRLGVSAKAMGVWAVATLLVLSVLSPAVALVGTQPMADGQSGTASAASGDKIWNTSIGVVSAGPTIVNGRVYVGTNQNKVHSLDAESGEMQWTASLGPNGGTSDRVVDSPTVANGTVFVVSDESKLAAFDAETGAEEWSATVSTGIGFDSPPTVSNGSVFVGTVLGDIYSFDAKTGGKQWNSSTGSQIDAAPTIANNSVFVGSYDNYLYSFDVESGQKEWDTSLGDSIGSSPTVENGSVYAGSDAGSLYALNAETGQQQWSASLGQVNQIGPSPTVANGSVFIGSHDNNVYSFDATTGAEEWTYTTNDLVVSSPTYAAGNIYIGSYDNNVYSIDAETGSRNWRYPTGDSVSASPIVSDGVVYAGSRGSIGAFALETSHTKTSSGSRNRLHTLNHVGDVYESDSTGTATPTPGEGSERLRLDAPVYMEYGETDNYTVSYESNSTGWSDVTGQATVTSDQPDLVSVQGTTLVATNNTSKAGRALITAEYQGESAYARVTVANATVENIQYLPNTYRFTALLSDSTLYWLLLSTLVGVAAGRYTSAFGALGAGQLALTVGWLGGYVSWAIAATSLFVALFIGLNLAERTSFMGARGGFR